MKIALVYILLIIGTVSPIQAAVIISRCPSVNTDLSQGSSIPPEPAHSPSRLDYKSSKSYIRRGADAISRITGWDLQYTDEDLALPSRMLDDLRLYISLIEQDEEKCISQRLAIFPYVRSFSPNADVSDLRVGYKICEFYQDNQRQITIEQTCRFIGRPEGYTLAALDKRFIEFNESVRVATTVLDVATLGLGLWGSGRALMAIRSSVFFAASGGLQKLIVSAIPLTASGILVASEYNHLPVEGMVEVRDAAKLLFDGKMEDVIIISIPMEKFEIALNAYLAPIPDPFQHQGY